MQNFLKILVIYFLTCLFSQAQEKPLNSNQAKQQESFELRTARNILNVVTQTKPLQDLILGYLDQFELLNRFINIDQADLISVSEKYIAIAKGGSPALPILIYNAQSGKITKTIPNKVDFIDAFELSSNSQYIALASEYKPEVCVIESSTGKNFFLNNQKGHSEKLLFSPQSTQLAIIKKAMAIFEENARGLPFHFYAYDLTKKSKVEPIEINAQEDSPTISAAFSPDGKQLAFGTEDQMIVLIALDTRIKSLFKMPKHEKNAGTLRDLKYSPDGKYLLCSYQYMTQIWDVKARSILVRTIQPDADLAFSPNGKYIISGVDHCPQKIADLPVKYLPTIKHEFGIRMIQYLTFILNGTCIARTYSLLPESSDQVIEIYKNQALDLDFPALSETDCNKKKPENSSGCVIS